MSEGDEVARQQTCDEWLAQRFKEIDYDLAHPEAQLLADHLQQLGIGTLVNMNKNQSIFRRCRSLTHGALPPPPDTWRTESNRVIIETIRTAIPRFITKSMREWDPKRASLATFFVNYCLIVFKTIYERFCAEETPGECERPRDNVVALFDSRYSHRDAQEYVLARAAVREMVALIGSATC
ncbi:MAG: hypothetical protein JO100_06365 [Pseudonocardia sp.]|nr:hypothetical protein [Pseudonocardia sp.]